MSNNFLKTYGFRAMFAVLLLFEAMICFAAVADINGKWTGSVKITDQGTHFITYTFQTYGDKLAGCLDAGGSLKTVIEGKISGNQFSFNLADDDGSSMWIPHRGQYHPEGDSVTITFNYAGIDHSCTLKRAANP